ncbi:MAG: DUF4189 domain-containing protein [Pseudorhodoplanes sp.]
MFQKALYFFIVLTLPASSACAEGAIVVGQNPGGGYGASATFNHQTRESAINGAMAHCRSAGALNCRLETQFNNLCFAITQGVYGGLTWSTRQEQHEASNTALRGCTENCHVASKGCDTFSEEAYLEQQRQYAEAQALAAEKAERAAEATRQAELDAQRAREAEAQRQQDEIWRQQRELEAKLALQEAETARLKRERDTEDQERIRKEQDAVRAAAQAAETRAEHDKEAGIILAFAFGLLFFYETRSQWTRLLGVLVQQKQSVIAHSEPLAIAASDTHIVADLPARVPPPIPAEPTKVEPIKSETAARALRLAHSYLAEVDSPFDALADLQLGKQQLQTATLAAKQIAIAEKNDPTARFQVDDIDLGISDLKAQALFLESICYMLEHRKKGLKILDQAIALRPDFPHYHYVAGVLWADTDRRHALRSFERAVALDPENLDYLKDLDRFKNVSLGERFVASGMKVAHGTMAATRKTLNVLWWTQMLIRWGLMAGFVFCLATQNWPGAGGTFVLMIIIGAFLKAKDHAVDKINETLGR